MADAQSLLSLIARGYAAGREDAATEALCFILSRSDSARAALSEFLGHSGGSLPIASFSTQFFTVGAYPDMACLDDNGDPLAFVESKFWASLTYRQPVTYWKNLPDDRPAVLLFLAPASRIAGIDEGWLWHELVERLRNAGHDLGPVDEREGVLTATSKGGQRRLMLTSWDALLTMLAERTWKGGEAQACFELAELRGLARDAIKNDDPVRDAQLKRLIASAVTQLKELGWASTEGLAVGGLEGDHYARFFRLAGRTTGLRIDYKAVKKTGKPLWLWFWCTRDSRNSVPLDEVRDKLGGLAEPLKWLPQDICLPIELPPRADCETTLCAIVEELERIARIIRPDGPTDCGDPTTV
ncbi:MAG: hypothetical protein F4Y02_02190 [Chloroflexi bacterium]|nr:hypothetical protein [Chloroflexota bacterium]